jgi:hypothetical protein
MSTPPRSRYQAFRRVLAPLAVVAALAVLLHQSCREEEHAAVSFALDFGDEAAQIRHVRADVWVGDDSVGYFEQQYGAAGAATAPRWKQPVPRDNVEVSISVTTADGAAYQVRRKVHAPGGAEVVIDARR